MRKKIIIGNWKMHKGPHAAMQLAKSIKLKLTDIRKTEVAVCPPSISIESVRSIVKGSRIKLGAQNMYLHKFGAYTGEISGEMIKESGCDYVLIGHSERRQHFHETDVLVNHKIEFALNDGLTPVVCVGETLSEREKNETESIIENQIRHAFKNISEENAEKIVLAYEPVWAIGTGKNASVDEADAVHEFIRQTLMNLYTRSLADKILIQYGGSVKPENAHALLSSKNIDGALIGGASLEAESFASIVHIAEKLG